MQKNEKCTVLIPGTFDAAKLWFIVSERPQFNFEIWLSKILRMKTIFIAIMFGGKKA